MNADEIVRVLRSYSQSLVGYKLGCEFADAVENGASLIESLQAQLDERDKEIERLRREVTNLAKESFERVRELAKLEAEVMQLWEAQRWTDAEYDTPDIGQAVLLYMPDKETYNIRVGEYLGEGDYRIGNKLYRGMEIDAWLPLPAAPEEGAGK